jgi:uncharacterized ferredoxin-like protein
MAIIDFDNIANEELVSVAKIGALAALNAPQITERVNVKTSIVYGKEDILPMIKFLRVKGEDSFVDFGEYRTLARCYEDKRLPVVLIIGCTNLRQMELNWNCGACGFATCDEFNKYAKGARGDVGAYGYGGGPFCIWKAMDAGIAYDWACAAIAECNVGNRPEASVGQAAMQLVPHVEDCEWVSGITIGPCGGDQVWFNRPALQETFTEKDVIEHLQKAIPNHFLAFPGTGDPKVKYGPDWETKPKYVRFEGKPEEFYKEHDKNRERIKKMIEGFKAERAKKAK